jgi:putative transposase
MFRAMIEYNCNLYGKKVFVIDRYYPSSQICSQCGKIHRLYEFPSVGLVMDRDLNAAINIERAGTAKDSLMKQMVTNAIMSGIKDAGSYVL